MFGDDKSKKLRLSDLRFKEVIKTHKDKIISRSKVLQVNNGWYWEDVPMIQETIEVDEKGRPEYY